MTDDGPEKSELQKIDEEYAAKLKELESKFERLGDLEHRSRMAELTPELHDELGDLEARAAVLKGSLSNSDTVGNSSMAFDKKSARGMGVGLSIAYAIIGLPLVGYGVGLLLDRQFGSKSLSGIFVLVGACGGIAFALYQLKRNEGKF